MSESSDILRLLIAERDRYILEAADIERRLSFIRNQMETLDALISGYAQEDRVYQSTGRLSNISSTLAFLQESPRHHNEEYTPISPTIKVEDRVSQFRHEPVVTNNPARQVSDAVSSETDEDEPFVDISDIPKIQIPRKPGAILPLPEFRDYSVQNAILIVLRRKPRTHFHVDALVRDIYGDKLSPDDFKAVKATVSKMLSTGLQQGVWYRVLHAQGVYTLTYEKGITTKPLKKR